MQKVRQTKSSKKSKINKIDTPLGRTKESLKIMNVETYFNPKNLLTRRP